jgi:putative flippase GtrA
VTSALWRKVRRFAAVGGVGFAVDAAVLWWLLRGGTDPFAARLVSFPVAVLATWWLNRIWTFPDAERAAAGLQLSRYLGVQVAGAACNYLVYAAVLGVIAPTPANALLALAAGSAVAALFNFLGAQRFVYLGGGPRPAAPGGTRGVGAGGAGGAGPTDG